jgi:hypothetical protein
MTHAEKSWDLRRNLLREDRLENKSLDCQMDVLNKELLGKGLGLTDGLANGEDMGEETCTL